MPPAWDTVVTDLVRDLGEITTGLGRAERLVRSTDVLDPARQAEREAARAISRAFNREGAPDVEIEATVREAPKRRRTVHPRTRSGCASSF